MKAWQHWSFDSSAMCAGVRADDAWIWGANESDQPQVRAHLDEYNAFGPVAYVPQCNSLHKHTISVLSYHSFSWCMRSEILHRHVPTAVLSRQTAGLRGKSLILNLPGKPKAIRETIDEVRGRSKPLIS